MHEFLTCMSWRESMHPPAFSTMQRSRSWFDFGLCWACWLVTMEVVAIFEHGLPTYMLCDASWRSYARRFLNSRHVQECRSDSLSHVPWLTGQITWRSNMEKASTTRPQVASPLKNATHLHGTVPGYFSAKKYLNPMLVYPIDNSRPSPTSGYRTELCQ